MLKVEFSGSKIICNKVDRGDKYDQSLEDALQKKGDGIFILVKAGEDLVLQRVKEVISDPKDFRVENSIEKKQPVAKKIKDEKLSPKLKAKPEVKKNVKPKRSKNPKKQ